jgi:long-subunit acyl-CoA synthetase (AMP-forming)
VNEPPHPTTVPAILDYAAAHFPDRLAYVESGRRVTWSELHILARSAAAGLIGLGLQPGDRTAICAENSIDWIVAYHATVLTGAAAALVYYDLAPAEIEAQVRRPRSRLLFASTTVLAKIAVPDLVERVILLGPGSHEGAIRLEHVVQATPQNPLSPQARPEPGRRGEGAGGEVIPDAPSSHPAATRDTAPPDDSASRGSGGAAHARGARGVSPRFLSLPGRWGGGAAQSDAQQARQLTSTNAQVSTTDEVNGALDARAPAPQDLAAIIYTSGTTGGAKGVMLSHRNLTTNCEAVLQTLDVSARDSVLLVLPLHHAMPFLATLLLPARVGAYFVIENDLRRIRDRLQEHRPTIFFGVPALYELVYRNILSRAESEGRLGLFLKLQRLVRIVKTLTGFNAGHLVFRQVHQALGGRLRFLFSGGAAISTRTLGDYFSLGLPLLQGWGMSEASPAVALQSFSKRRFRYTRYYERHVGSVGRALPGVEVKLIDVPDKDIRVAETGEGEVLVRGANVFMGYWDAPEETAATIQDGWLRTGDLARIDEDGNIYLTGRSKYVIVLDSGEKVIPDELEDTLSQSDLIADVCVLGRRVRDKMLVTAIIHPAVESAATLGAGDEASLQRLVTTEVDRLCKQLALYKRVTRIELSDEPLPKTPLRKVARGRIADVYEFDYARWLASPEAPSG